jgi:serine/threonine protein phosphatase PrpC
MKNEATGLLRRNGWRIAAATDCGRVRGHNEDVYCVDVDAGIFLVVDGVGGQAAGEVAARIAAERIQRRVERQDAPAHVRVREAITLANREILLKAESDPALAGMACVLTLAVLEDEELTIGHVGDSRLYRLDARGISKLTHDHSPVGELEDAREISETDAMRDDRRNEVYRDVGSEPRDPEAADFIELIRTRLDADAAMLICSDGLTDMLPALEVNRIARQYAGCPDAAVAALIAAANAVGGRDNVTVLLVEGPQYRGVPDGGRAFPPVAADRQEPTLPLADAIVPPLSVPGLRPASTSPIEQHSRIGGFINSVMHSRAVALVAGVVLGLLVPVGLVSVPEATVPPTLDRVLTVGESTSYQSIGAALAEARKGDLVQVEPGQYEESLTVPEGVELRATKAGEAVLVAPAGATNWTAIDATGTGSTVRGFRITATGAAPMVSGVVVAASDVTLDDMTLEGAMDLGVDVRGQGTTVQASHFDRLSGTGVRLAEAGAALRQNVFTSAGPAAFPAVQAVGAVAASLDRNVFMHFPRVVEPAGRSDDLIGRNNFVIVATLSKPPVRAKR